MNKLFLFFSVLNGFCLWFSCLRVNRFAMIQPSFFCVSILINLFCSSLSRYQTYHQTLNSQNTHNHPNNRATQDHAVAAREVVTTSHALITIDVSAVVAVVDQEAKINQHPKINQKKTNKKSKLNTQTHTLNTWDPNIMSTQQHPFESISKLNENRQLD